MKKYIKVNNIGNKIKATHLKVELYYDLGGMNYFTGNGESRGYYLSISPVERGEIFESYTGFTGIKKCIKQVKRKSNKAYNEAISEINNTNIEQDLIKQVCQNQGLEIVQ